MSSTTSVSGPPLSTTPAGSSLLTSITSSTPDDLITTGNGGSGRVIDTTGDYGDSPNSSTALWVVAVVVIAAVAIIVAFIIWRKRSRSKSQEISRDIESPNDLELRRPLNITPPPGLYRAESEDVIGGDVLEDLPPYEPRPLSTISEDLIGGDYIPNSLGLAVDIIIDANDRSLWSQLPTVINSGILNTLSPKEIKMQEALFEITTSEVTYSRSINVVCDLFYKSTLLSNTITEQDKAILFGNILEICDCSRAFIKELFAEWQQSHYIRELRKILSTNTRTRFRVYKEYLKNMPFQMEKLDQLLESNQEFTKVLKVIERDGKCKGQDLKSLLGMPMQRIMRFPMLLEAVVSRMDDCEEKAECQRVLKSLKDLAMDCNEAAGESKDDVDKAKILASLEFGGIPKNPIDFGDFLITDKFKVFDGKAKPGTFKLRQSKPEYNHIFLFFLKLIITKAERNGKYEVIDVMDTFQSKMDVKPENCFLIYSSFKSTYEYVSNDAKQVQIFKEKLHEIQNADIISG